MPEIRDISAAVDEYSAVFPGDTAYSQRPQFSIWPDCPVNVNAITLSPHTGAPALCAPALCVRRCCRRSARSGRLSRPLPRDPLPGWRGLVEPGTSAALQAHHQLLQHDMRVLENLVLDDVPEGDHELSALPMKLVRADASPARAILRTLP